MAIRRKKFTRFIPVYIMALPGLIYLFINNYLPMFGIIIAFKHLDFRLGILNSPWAGLDNFMFLFRTRDALTMTRNTILYNVAFFIIGTVLAFFTAVLLNEIRSKMATKFFQSTILIPHLMSWVVVGYLSFAFLASDTGFINNTILNWLGIEPVSWYTTGRYWPFILTIVQMWKSVGFTMIIYLAGIVSIDTGYYEAARIDGANKWKQIVHITLPLLVPTILTLAMINVGRIFFSDFGLFFQIPRNSGILFNYTQTIDVFVFNALMVRGDLAMSSAASVYQSIVGFILIVSVNAVIRRIRRENALF